MKLEEALGWAKGSCELQKHGIELGFHDEIIILLCDRITELETQLKIKHGLLEDCQKWMDYHNERADKAEAQRDELLEALKYYEEKAQAIARYMKEMKGNALQAVMTELSLDGGAKARIVIEQT